MNVLISILVIVPNKIALHLFELELIVVHFSNDFRVPLLVEQTEFLAKIDSLVGHYSCFPDGASERSV
jgi:hypothetical protein